MKRLILMRHAKSDWSGKALSDFDRELNKRGRESATALGNWLRSESIRPDEVLCSSAARTQETFHRLNLEGTAQTLFTRDLYLASEDQMLANVAKAKGNCVLLVGHNPGIGALAETIVKMPPSHPQFRTYPTGATLVADFEIADWAQVVGAKAIARHFVVPREL